MNIAALQAASVLLMFAVIPLWIVAGLADYLCHRASRIAETSGTKESVLHLLQFSLVGLPIVLALFLRPNAGFFLITMVCLVLHHIVAYVDVRYANGTRDVTPGEQMIHSVLEIAPITALGLLIVLSWSQLQALFGMGQETARFFPEVRLVSPAYAVAVLCAAFFLNAVPYGEELLRCLRFKKPPS